MSDVNLRNQTVQDAAAIRQLITAAFATAAHSCGREQDLMEALWTADAATVALVAESANGLVGQVACSPVTIDGRSGSWFGLGPLAVRPDRQRQGIGSALVRAALQRLHLRQAAGCVLVGDPAFYARFGFRPAAPLCLPGVPAPYFLALPFRDGPPAGVVAFHPAFTLAADG